MKIKLFFAIMLLFSIVASAQTSGTRILFEDDFESYDDFIISNIGSWVVRDKDGLMSYTGADGIMWENRGEPMGFMIFNPSEAGVVHLTSNPSRNFDPKSGKKYAGSWRGIPSVLEGVDANDDWLISPEITLGDSANEVSFWVKSLSDTQGLESYRVVIYPEGTSIYSYDFVTISGNKPLIAPFKNWEQKTFNLDAYANQKIRIGINCVSQEKLLFMVDDFKVTTADEDTLKTTDFFTENFSIFPNPANDVLNIAVKKDVEIKGAQIMDLSGKNVKSLPERIQTDEQVNIADLNEGVYFISIQTDKGTATSKFLKN